MVDLLNPDNLHEHDGNANGHRNDVSSLVCGDRRDLLVVATFENKKPTLLLIGAIPETKTMTILPLSVIIVNDFGS